MAAAVARVRRQLTAKDLHLPVIGLISTWNSRCGIADYARSLVCGIEPERLRVFATKVSGVHQGRTRLSDAVAGPKAGRSAR